MSYIVKLETQSDVDNVIRLMDAKYTVYSLDGDKKPKLGTGMYIDVYIGFKDIYVGTESQVECYPSDKRVTSDELLKIIGINKD